MKNQMITIFKVFLVLLLLAGAFVFTMFQGSFVSWFVFYSFLPFATYSIGFSFYRLSAITIHREIENQTYTAGDRVQATILLTRKIPFPLYYLVVEEVLPETLVSQPHPKTILFPGFKTKLSFEYSIPSVSRGFHELTTIKLRAADFLGLVVKEVELQLTNEFFVYPECKDIDFSQNVSQEGNQVTSHRIINNSDFLLAVGAREYQPGDKVSWIDWKTTARKQKVMSKEFDKQKSQQIYLVLDRFNNQAAEGFEKAVTLTASLSQAIIKKGINLSLVSVGEDRSVFENGNSHHFFHEIYHHLAQVKNDTKITFDQVVKREILHVRQNGTCILITSHLHHDSVKLIEKLSIQNHILLFLIDVKGNGHQLELLKGTPCSVKVMTAEDFHRTSIEVNAR